MRFSIYWSVGTWKGFGADFDGPFLRLRAGPFGLCAGCFDVADLLETHTVQLRRLDDQLKYVQQLEQDVQRLQFESEEDMEQHAAAEERIDALEHAAVVAQGTVEAAQTKAQAAKQELLTILQYIRLEDI